MDDSNDWVNADNFTTPAMLADYCRIAEPYLAHFKPNTCIEQTRIFVECMRLLGIQAEAAEVSLFVMCSVLNYGFASGFNEEQKQQAAAKALQWIEAPRKHTDAPYHVVALAQLQGHWYLVDSTLAQASAPSFGFHIPKAVMVIGPLERRLHAGDELQGSFALDTGIPIEVSWGFTGTHTYQTAPGWEPSHLWPLIYGIITEMEATMQLTFEPDRGGAHPFRRKIVKIVKINNTISGHHILLECGHQQTSFGDLSYAVNGVICHQCADEAGEWPA